MKIFKILLLHLTAFSIVSCGNGTNTRVHIGDRVIVKSGPFEGCTGLVNGASQDLYPCSDCLSLRVANIECGHGEVKTKIDQNYFDSSELRVVK